MHADAVLQRQDQPGVGRHVVQRDLHRRHHDGLLLGGEHDAHAGHKRESQPAAMHTPTAALQAHVSRDRQRHEAAKLECYSFQIWRAACMWSAVCMCVARRSKKCAVGVNTADIAVEGSSVQLGLASANIGHMYAVQPATPNFCVTKARSRIHSVLLDRQKLLAAFYIQLAV